MAATVNAAFMLCENLAGETLVAGVIMRESFLSCIGLSFIFA
jgi:hypothetical protein